MESKGILVRRKILRRWLPAILLGAVLIALPLGLRGLLGQGPPPIIEFLYSREGVDSLRAALADPEMFSALEDRMAYSALWHVSTIPQGSGYRHTFFFAGRRRNTTRIQGLAAVTSREGAGWKVSGTGEEFSYLHLELPAVARSAEELEVLRAAFEDPGVRGALLGILEYRKMNLESMTVGHEPGDPRLRVAFHANAVDSVERVTLGWWVEEDPAGSSYVFVND